MTGSAGEVQGHWRHAGFPIIDADRGARRLTGDADILFAAVYNGSAARQKKCGANYGP